MNRQSSCATSFTSDSSSRRTSLSSSRPEFRPIHSEIIRRNLVTDFLEASSLPGNVVKHRAREEAGKMFGEDLSSRVCEEEWSNLIEDESLKGHKKCKGNTHKPSLAPE